MECICCGAQTGIFSDNSKDGRICKKCMMYIPKTARLMQLTGNEVIELMRYGKEDVKEIRKVFRETASYGQLHIDGRNGYVAIYDGASAEIEDRLPQACVDVWDILCMQNPEITVKETGVKDRVVSVDVTFYADIMKPRMSVKRHIKSAKCRPQQINEASFAYYEPPALTTFRAIFKEMRHSALRKYTEEQEYNFISPHAVELMKARALYMVGDTYTAGEIKKQRNRLMKVYHPDEGGKEDLSAYAKIINDAYRLLKEAL